jgi:hypothetical protein
LLNTVHIYIPNNADFVSFTFAWLTSSIFPNWTTPFFHPLPLHVQLLLSPSDAFGDMQPVPARHGSPALPATIYAPEQHDSTKESTVRSGGLSELRVAGCKAILHVRPKWAHYHKITVAVPLAVGHAW